VKTMDERKEYLRTAELRADDEISPRPSDFESGGGRKTEISHAENDEADDTARVPRAANSE